MAAAIGSTLPANASFLVLGASGGTGKHFIAKTLEKGHKTRVLVRTPSKLSAAVSASPNLQIVQGSITDPNLDTDKLTEGIDIVVRMLGDREAQSHGKIVTPFIQRLIPSMRRSKTHRILYQAGGFSKPYGVELSFVIWALRKTIARSYEGQHQDNDAVMEYFSTQAMDIEWINHRAGIGGDGPLKRTLQRSTGSRPSIATFSECADYSYRIVFDNSAIHTSDFSSYV